MFTRPRASAPTPGIGGRQPAGIELTDACVRVVHAPSGRRAEVPLPRGAVVAGEILDVGVVATALRAAWSQGRIPTRAVVVGVNNADVVARLAELPALDDRDLLSTLRFELGDLVPFDAADAEVDLRRIGPVVNDRGVPGVRVLAVAAARSMVADHVAACRAARLRCVGVDYSPFALVRAVARSEAADSGAATVPGDEGAEDLSGDEPARPGSVGIVAIDDDMLTVAVHRGGVASFCRSLATHTSPASNGGELEAELTLIEQYQRRRAGASELAHRQRTDPLVAAIRGTLEYASTQPGGEPVERIVLVGDGARASDVAAQLRASTLLPVTLVDPLAEGSPVVETTAFTADGASRFATAYGLSITGDDGALGPTRLRLMGARGQAVSPRALAVRAGVTAGITLVALGALTVVAGPDVDGAEAEQAAAEQRAAAAASALREVDDLHQQVQLAKRLERSLDRIAGSQIDWPRLVADIRRSAPPGTSLVSLQGSVPTTERRRTVPGSIQLVGRAASQSSISTWVEALDDIEGLGTPWIESVSSRDGGDATFTITAELDDPAGVGRTGDRTEVQR